MANKWNDFGARLNSRIIRGLDVISILIFDAIIPIIAYLVIRVIDQLQGGENAFFAAAKAISSVVFLLLYVAWIFCDLREFYIKTYS